jgi:hypothetical protein
LVEFGLILDGLFADHLTEDSNVVGLYAILALEVPTLTIYTAEMGVFLVGELSVGAAGI